MSNLQILHIIGWIIRIGMFLWLIDFVKFIFTQIKDIKRSKLSPTWQDSGHTETNTTWKFFEWRK